MGGLEADGPTVSGLRNLDRTCYFNASLQALASCQSLLDQLNQVLRLFDALPAATGGTPAAAAASSALAAALLDCLQRLQPQPGSASSSSFAPRHLLDVFRSRLPPGVLEAGEEHDVAEAIEILCSLVSEELQASFVGGPTKRRLLGRASLATLLRRPGSSSIAGSGRESSQPHVVADAGLSIGTGSVHAGSTCCSGGSCEMESCAAGEGTCDNSALLTDEASVLSSPAGSSTSTTSISAGAPADAGCGMAGSSRAAAPGAAEAAGSAPALAAAAAHPEHPSSPAAVPAAHAAPESTAVQAAPAVVASGGCPQAPLPDAVLQGWRLARLPLEGTNAHERQCLACQHRPCVQLCPYWVLPLGIPLARGRTLLGNVPAAPGACLQGCLAAFFGFEHLHGLHCTRCSLRASLEAGGVGATVAGTAAGDPAGSGEQGGVSAGSEAVPLRGQQGDALAGAALPPHARIKSQVEQLGQAVADRGSLLLESEAYRGMLERAGLAWLPRPASAASRAVAAELPRVLCLQLRRAFWSEHGHVKVSGHVEYPLRLQLPLDLVPRFGHKQPLQAMPGSLTAGGTALAAAAAAAAAAGQLQPCGRSHSLPPQPVPYPSSPPPPLFLLRAVVEHHGGLAGAGHYTLFRCLDSLGAQQAQRDPSSQHWVRVSDEEVQPASIREVLAAEASMLLYERLN